MQVPSPSAQSGAAVGQAAPKPAWAVVMVKARARVFDSSRSMSIDSLRCTVEVGSPISKVHFCPETLSIIETSGRKRASTIVPTTPPRITTIAGSRRLNSDWTATSTSSS